MVLLLLVHRLLLSITNAFEFVVRNCNDANRNTIINDDADADDVNDFDIADDPDVDVDADNVNLLHFILTMHKLFR